MVDTRHVHTRPPARLSIVLGTLNRHDQLVRAVESIVRETHVPFHLYVTDAGSTDGTIEYLEGLRDTRIIPILVGKKLGQARAYNDVFTTVETPWTCWLSDDNEVVNGGLDTAVRILEEDPKIGMVGLKVTDVQGPFAEAPYIGGVTSCGVLNVNQGMLPTALLHRLGGFSERFRDYGIDPDLTTRVLSEGYDVVYTREVAIQHFRNWETDESQPEFARMAQRQKDYLALYEKVHGARFGNSARWILKRVFWKAIRGSMGVDLNSRKRFLGMTIRDWHNLFVGRFITLRRELTTRDKASHLRQSLRHDRWLIPARAAVRPTEEPQASNNASVP